MSANRLGRFRVFLGLPVGVAISLALLATIMIVLVEKARDRLITALPQSGNFSRWLMSRRPCARFAPPTPRNLGLNRTRA